MTNLPRVEDLGLSTTGQAIFEALKSTLQNNADSQARYVRLADDIEFFYNSREEGSDSGVILEETWNVIIEIACHLPSGHPWQDSLVQSLDDLRRRDNVAQEATEVRRKMMPNCDRELMDS